MFAIIFFILFYNVYKYKLQQLWCVCPVSVVSRLSRI